MMTADERLSIELPCVRCGYLLRGLLPEDACPECGTPVAEALRDNHLAAADPRWRRRLRAGLGVLVVAIGLQLLTLPGGLWTGLGLWLASFFGPASLVAMMQVRFFAGTIIAWLWLVGLWWATAVEPGREAATRPGLRRAVRVLGAAGVGLATACAAIALVLALPWMGNSTTILLLFEGIRIVGTIAVALAAVLLLHHLRRQGARAPAPGFARSRTAGVGIVFGWMAVLLGPVGGVLQIIVMVAWTQGNLAFVTTDLWQTMVGLVTFGAAGVGLVFALCQIVYYFRLRRRVPVETG